MAMVDCRECDKKVSSKALKCPACGIQLRKAKRGFFGTIFKWLFILFNIFMIFILATGIAGVSDMPDAQSQAEQAGRAIGATMGIGMILTLWVMGDIILGLFVLFTKPK